MFESVNSAKIHMQTGAGNLRNISSKTTDQGYFVHMLRRAKLDRQSKIINLCFLRPKDFEILKKMAGFDREKRTASLRTD
jgi:hypothetical protein